MLQIVSARGVLRLVSARGVLQLVSARGVLRLVSARSRHRKRNRLGCDACKVAAGGGGHFDRSKPSAEQVCRKRARGLVLGVLVQIPGGGGGLVFIQIPGGGGGNFHRGRRGGVGG